MTPDDPADRTAAPVDGSERPRLPFAVVGVGASAGGLEAYTELLHATPPDTGMAFVLVQHLPPDRETLLADILGKQTAMPVILVEDGMAVEPNHVYVIRPGHTLTLKAGRLHLGEPLARPGHNRPIDDFFKSLAEEQRERAVAVVLSGMGSNGSAGAETVKAVGGLCVAQDPEAAKYPSMPRNLIDNNLADFVLRPAEMPAVLARYAGHPYAAGGRAAEAVARREAKALADILAVLRTRTRHDFAGYRKPTMVRRVQRRMGLHQIEAMADYATALRRNAAEASALADDLLIHVTGFFRDPEAWEALREKVIAPLVEERDDGGPVRAWVAACATGEEAYTLAMLLVEAAEAKGKQFDIKVFATDMAERALGHARAGVFPGGIEAEVTPDRLERFFDKDDASYRIKKPLRELVVFAPQNVLQDPPFSRLDIATRRNLLIYLEPEVQRRVLSLLHFGLREGGALMLGTTETAGPPGDEFEPIDKRARLFRRVGPTRHGKVDFPVLRLPTPDVRTPGADIPPPRASVAQVANRVLLDRYAPAAVVVDRHGQIVYYHGPTERYLDQPRGEPTRDLVALAKEPVRGAVRAALGKVIGTNDPATVRDGLMDFGAGPRRVHVDAVPLGPRAGPGLYLVGFTDHPEPPAPVPGDGPLDQHDLVNELHRVRDELQDTVEELQTSNEEMKASHEEVTSVNEELQSTNEELETSKEELQSLNEELTTVNAQLTAKMEELERTTNDLGSLLSSTDIAVLFLDPKFRIRRYTPALKGLIDLIPSDVGRPLLDLRRKFADPELLADAQAVLDRLIPVEREVASDAGRTYVRRVLPYRTADNRIDGVVVTFVDVTDRRQAEAALRAIEDEYRTLFETMNQGYALCRLMRDDRGRAIDFAYLEINPAFHTLTGLDPAAVVGHRLSEILPGIDPFWLATYARVVETGRPARFERELPELGRVLDVTAYPRGGDRFAALFDDITTRNRAEAERRAAEERQAFLLRLSDALRAEPDADAVTNRALRILSEQLHLDRCYVGVYRPADDRADLTHQVGNDRVPPLPDRIRLSDFPEALRVAADGTLVIDDFAVTEGLSDTDRRNIGALGLRALVAAGLRKGENDLIWTIVAVSARPRQWTRGEVALIEEVTERTWAAVERAKAEADLRASEEQFRRAIEDAPIPVLLQAEDGDILQLSRTWTELTGYALPDLPTADAWLTRAYGPGADALRGHAHELFAGARKSLDVEFSIRTKNGADRHWSFSASAPGTLRDGRRFLVGMAVDITPRREAEDALRESRAFHELVAGLGSDWWFAARVGSDGSVVTDTLSDEFTRQLGYTRDELMAAGGWAVLVHPDDLPKAERQMARLLAGETIEGEMRHVAKDGRVVWYQYRTRPGFDAAGRVNRLYGASRDVTGRKRVEAYVRESEERFRGLAEAVPQIVWSSTDDAVDYFNRRWWEYTGLDPATGLGEAWHEVVHPDDRPAALERSTRAAATGEDYEIEYRLRRADGAYRWHIARAARVPSLGRWFGTATDVHDLREAVAALRERDEQLALAQRAAGLGVSSLDLGTMVGITTPEWRDVVGMPDPPAPQDFAAFLDRVHPDDRGRVAALHAAPPGPDGLEFEFRVRHPARGERWVLSRSRLLLDAGPDRLVGIALDVTDRKRAEAALRESNQRFRAVAANLPNAAAFVVGPDLRYQLADGEAFRAAGFTAADMEGKTIHEVLPPDLAAEYEGNYRRALAGEPFRVEHSAHGRHYVTHGAPLRDAAGAVSAALAVSYEITDRVRAEAALRASEGRFQAALAAARMGTWTWDVAADRHTRDGYLNRLLGLDPVETTAPLAEFIDAHVHPDDRAAVRAAFAASVEHGKGLNVEFRVVRPGGAVRWLRDQGDVFGPPGGPAMTGACVDITDRREAEERLRRVVESVTDYAIVTLDPGRRVTTWNPAAEAVFGYPEGEIVGRSADVLFTPEDRAAGVPEKEAETARRAGRAADERWHLRRDGSRFFASGVMTPLGGEGLVKVARDLTDRKRMEDELRDARGKLEARVAARTAELAEAVAALRAEMGERAAAEAARAELVRRLVRVQEDERRRVARDLHDQVGQTLTALALAARAARDARSLGAATARLADVQRLADEVGRETHALAVRLRPTALDDLGLEAAVGQLVADWSNRTGVPIDFHAAGVGAGRLPAEVETVLYRVVQEALTNVAKHARANTVSVILERPDGHAVAVVEDDGAGFDPAAVAPDRLGLAGMRERVAWPAGRWTSRPSRAGGRR